MFSNNPTMLGSVFNNYFEKNWNLNFYLEFFKPEEDRVQLYFVCFFQSSEKLLMPKKIGLFMVPRLTLVQTPRPLPFFRFWKKYVCISDFWKYVFLKEKIQPDCFQFFIYDPPGLSHSIKKNADRPTLIFLAKEP